MPYPPYPSHTLADGLWDVGKDETENLYSWDKGARQFFHELRDLLNDQGWDNSNSTSNLTKKQVYWIVAQLNRLAEATLYNSRNNGRLRNLAEQSTPSSPEDETNIPLPVMPAGW